METKGRRDICRKEGKAQRRMTKKVSEYSHSQMQDYTQLIVGYFTVVHVQFDLLNMLQICVQENEILYNEFLSSAREDCVSW
jgi:hypothetical protein